MINWIQGFGEFVVGLTFLIILAVILVLGLIELFDAITGADKRKQAEKEHMQARLDSLEENKS